MTAVLLLALASQDSGLEELASNVGAVSHPQTISALEAFVASHPGDPNVDRALLLEAQLYRADGDDAHALEVLNRILAAPGFSAWRRDAALERASLDVAAWRFGAALSAYGWLAHDPDERRRYQARMGAAEALAMRARLYLGCAISFALVAVVLWRLARARRALLPPTEEVTYALPLVVLLGIAALSQPAAEARAVLTLAGGGLVLLWANSSFWRLRRPRGLLRVVEPAFAAGQAFGLLYCAIVSNNLWHRLVETFVNGAEG